jgi:hypothetical protein
MKHGQHGTFDAIPLGLNQWDEFRYLVPHIEQLIPNAHLAPGAGTIGALDALGGTMPTEAPRDSNIPAPYTYLGQFIDHDITLTVPSPGFDPNARIQEPTFTPVPPELLPRLLRNARTSAFDLDSLYGVQPPAAEADLAVPFIGDKFAIGHVSPVGNRPPGKLDDNDLPRVVGGPRARRARIGDARNDENLIVSQLHLAFLKFHNAVVDLGHDFDSARDLVTQHYQWIVVTDFLPRICDPEVVRSVLEHGNRLYRPRFEKFMPLEFAVAGFRIGHSMIRSSYDFNVNFKKAGGVQGPGSLQLLFKFTGLSGDLGGQPTLPENWIAQWEMLLADRAMQLDPSITQPLANLPGEPAGVMQRLAKRNLLKGLLFSLPTGQALAQALLQPAQRLTPQQILAACNPEGSPSQQDVVKQHDLHNRTPLWLYVLAEAKAKGQGDRLGPLGSLIVAETIIGLIRQSRRSILSKAFVPTLGKRIGHFDLQDLLMRAGVLAARVG